MNRRNGECPIIGRKTALFIIGIFTVHLSPYMCEQTLIGKSVNNGLPIKNAVKNVSRKI